MNHEIGGSNTSQTDQEFINEWWPSYENDKPNNSTESNELDEPSNLDWSVLTQYAPEQSNNMENSPTDFSREAFEKAYSEISKENPDLGQAEARRIKDIFEQIQNLVALNSETGQKPDLASYRSAFGYLTTDIGSALKLVEKRSDVGDPAVLFQKRKDINTAKTLYNEAYRSVAGTPEDNNTDYTTSDSPSKPETSQPGPKAEEVNKIELPGDLIG